MTTHSTEAEEVRKVSLFLRVLPQDNILIQQYDEKPSPVHKKSKRSGRKGMIVIKTDKNEVQLTWGDQRAKSTIIRYSCFDRVLTIKSSLQELYDTFIYANSSPVSYFLNGFNAILLTLGNTGTCKSRTLFSEDLSSDLYSSRSVIGQLVQNVSTYCEINRNIYQLGLSVGQILPQSQGDLWLKDCLSTKPDVQKAHMEALNIINISSLNHFEYLLRHVAKNSNSFAHAKGKISIKTTTGILCVSLNILNIKTQELCYLVILDTGGLDTFHSQASLPNITGQKGESTRNNKSSNLPSPANNLTQLAVQAILDQLQHPEAPILLGETPGGYIAEQITAMFEPILSNSKYFILHTVPVRTTISSEQPYLNMLENISLTQGEITEQHNKVIEKPIFMQFSTFKKFAQDQNKQRLSPYFNNQQLGNSVNIGEHLASGNSSQRKLPTELKKSLILEYRDRGTRLRENNSVERSYKINNSFENKEGGTIRKHPRERHMMLNKSFDYAGNIKKKLQKKSYERIQKERLEKYAKNASEDIRQEESTPDTLVGGGNVESYESYDKRSLAEKYREEVRANKQMQRRLVEMKSFYDEKMQRLYSVNKRLQGDSLAPLSKQGELSERLVLQESLGNMGRVVGGSARLGGVQKGNLGDGMSDMKKIIGEREAELTAKERRIFTYERKISGLQLRNSSMESKLSENQLFINNLLNKLDYLQGGREGNHSKPPNPYSHITHTHPRKSNYNIQSQRSPQELSLDLDSLGTSPGKVPFLIDKGKLIDNHNSIKDSKNVLFENIEKLEKEMNVEKNGKAIGYLDSIMSNVDLLFNIIHEFEIKELSFIQMMAKEGGASASLGDQGGAQGVPN